jgi:hypothetical protein
MQMEQGMMGQGSYCGMGLYSTSTMTSSMPGHIEFAGIVGSRQMDAKTRGLLLQLQGEMLKAMGDVMLKYGQTLREAQ